MFAGILIPHSILVQCRPFLSFTLTPANNRNLSNAYEQPRLAADVPVVQPMALSAGGFVVYSFHAVS